MPPLLIGEARKRQRRLGSPTRGAGAKRLRGLVLTWEEERYEERRNGPPGCGGDPLHPEIPWQDVIGIRNHIAHGYLDIDGDIVLDVIKNNLDDLLAAIEYFIAKF